VPVRLRTRAEFLAVRRGRRLNGPFFLVEACRRADAGPARYGLTVTRKVGNAAERNRIKRRLREAVRLASGAEMVPGVDYVIVARRELLHLPFETLTGELSRRVSKARRLEPAPEAPSAPPADTSDSRPAATDTPGA